MMRDLLKRSSGEPDTHGGGTKTTAAVRFRTAVRQVRGVGQSGRSGRGLQVAVADSLRLLGCLWALLNEGQRLEAACYWKNGEHFQEIAPL